MPCPRCGSPAALGPENMWRPFCSERCKLIDLGSWAAEDYRIAEPAQPEKPEDSAAD
ncbi:MAG TPA: DNA gyrase inhibitor YacG [Burkholderiales bacterium]|nr:DNA gyrase inhibitor YacG [Burkholderiales bacterium]